jgi:hypothetical protein
MTTRKYILSYDKTSFKAYEIFNEKFQNCLLERMEASLGVGVCDKTNFDQAGSIFVYEINNVCVNIYTNYRTVRTTIPNENARHWNLRMIGSEKNIQVAEINIQLQGFSLEEFVLR